MSFILQQLGFTRSESVTVSERAATTLPTPPEHSQRLATPLKARYDAPDFISRSQSVESCASDLANMGLLALVSRLRTSLITGRHKSRNAPRTEIILSN